MSCRLEYVYRCTYSKKRVKSGDGKGSGSGKLSDIYKPLFLYHHLLPDEVGRQKPKVLFELIDSLSEDDEQEEYTGNDPYLKMFYGQ